MPNVNAEELALIVGYLKRLRVTKDTRAEEKATQEKRNPYYIEYSAPSNDIPKPLPSGIKSMAELVPKKIISQEDADMVGQLGGRQLQQLILAANYMDIPELLALCCAQHALHIMLLGGFSKECREFFEVEETAVASPEE